MTLAAVAGGKKKDIVGNLRTCAFPSGVLLSAGLAEISTADTAARSGNTVFHQRLLSSSKCVTVQLPFKDGRSGGRNVTSTTSVPPSVGEVPSLQNLRFQVSSGRRVLHGQLADGTKLISDLRTLAGPGSGMQAKSGTTRKSPGSGGRLS